MTVHLKISHKIISAIVLPAILALSLLGYMGYQVWVSLQEAQTISSLVITINKLDAIAHEHALERNLTSGFLNSQGDPKIKAKLMTQRQKADSAHSDLAIHLDNPQAKPYKELLSRVVARLEGKTVVRERVDALSPDSDAIEYYSKINNHAIEVVLLLINDVPSEKLRQELLAFSRLLIIKERAAQERGELNKIFTQKKASLNQYNAVSGYMEQQTLAGMHYTALSEPQAAERFNKAINAPELSKFYSYRHQFLAQRRSLPQVSGPDPQEWFDAATTRIESLKKISQIESEKITQDAHRLYEKTLLNSIIIMTLIFTVMSISSLLLINTLRKIISRVQLLDHSLEQVIESGNLIDRVKDDSGDELSTISDHINKMLDSLEGSITVASDLSFELGNRTKEFSIAISENQKIINEQFQSTKEVSEEMEQVAIGIKESASSLTEVLLSQNEVKKTIASSKDTFSQSQEALAQMIMGIENANEMMKVFISQTKPMVELINNIEDIAAQTQLLAVNVKAQACLESEQGRQFANSAEHIEDLSTQAKYATSTLRSMLEKQDPEVKNIHQMIAISFGQAGTLAEKVNQTTNLITRAETQLGSMGQILDVLAEHGKTQLNTVSDLAKETQKTALLAKRSSGGAAVLSASAIALNRISQYLETMVKQYQLGEKNRPDINNES